MPKKNPIRDRKGKDTACAVRASRAAASPVPAILIAATARAFAPVGEGVQRQREWLERELRERGAKGSVRKEATGAVRKGANGEVIERNSGFKDLERERAKRRKRRRGKEARGSESEGGSKRESEGRRERRGNSREQG